MKINLNLKHKFNLLLALVFLAGIYLSSLALSKVLSQQAEQKLNDEGNILMQLIEEVKYYTSANLLASYQQQVPSSEFKSSFIPAYAARKIFNNFKAVADFQNYEYKEATLNPTNLADLPDNFEQSLINTFRQDRGIKILSGYTQKSERDFYYIARPLTVKDSSCLQCHGNPDIAPPKMVELYGNKHGFNWQLNQLTSAQTIYIPANSIAQNVKQGMLTLIPWFTSIFAVVILVINRLLQHTVIKPLNQLTKAANQLSTPNSDFQAACQLNYLDQLTTRNDESGKLTKAFLIMAKKIFDRECNLRQAIVSSTKELKQEIKERTIIEQKLAEQIQRALLQEKQSHQEIEAAQQEAEIANRSKSNFLANISHELRTPLNAIIGFSQLMNRDQTMSSEQQKTINIINRSGEHLLEMINKILEMSKIEAGKTELNLVDVDLKQLLSSIEAMLGIKAKAKNLQLHIKYLSDVPNYICTDEGKLRQVLINLISNAIKFTSTGTITIVVSHQYLENNANCNLKFAIEDTGVGIAPEAITHIFQTFNQSESNCQSKQCTGLGLPISKKFVELMGGQLEVISQINQGSIFSFNIIAELSNRAKIKCPSTAKIVESIAPNNPSCRILVVDDVWQSRLLIIKLLSQVGFEVQEAENGQQAVEVSQQWQPHLILMDMRMPIMDGYQATQQIRLREKNSAFTNPCKIIALTASVFELKQTKMIEAGCDDYLYKPFKEYELFSKIKKHLKIEYIYQQDADDFNRLNQKVSSQLTIESLQVLSETWRQEFKQAAAELDEIKLTTLIQEIPPEHSKIARALTDLVHNFEFEIIFELIPAIHN